MTRRFQFSLRALLHFYAIALLAGGLLIAGTAFGSAIEAATASALAETVSSATDSREAFTAAYEHLESQSRRNRVIFSIFGLMVSAASVPLFMAAERVS